MACLQVDLHGMLVDEATRELEDLALNLGSMAYRYSEGIALKIITGLVPWLK